MSSRVSFPCNTCCLVFENSQDQRNHMRDPWHVYNLKRRMTCLSPISAHDYAETVATFFVSSKQESLHAMSSSTVASLSQTEKYPEESGNSKDLTDERAQVDCCLFCAKNCGSLELSVEHMFSEHSLYIPEAEYLSSLETIIEYLHTVITEYKECLYCGVTKQSARDIRRHMLDKSHCMINLEREPELLEFWEFPDGESHFFDGEDNPESQGQDSSTVEPGNFANDEYMLLSGKVIESKSKAREARRLARRSAFAAKSTLAPVSTKDSINNTGKTSLNDPADSSIAPHKNTLNRTVAVRDANGLVGVSEQQMRSLTTVQRKTQRQQALVQASAAWAGDKGGIHQRHYKVKMNLRDG